MALVPIISGSGFYDRRSIVSAPALPVWTYTAGAVGSGQFTADQGDPPSTTSITLAEQAKNGPSVFTNFFSTDLPVGSLFYLTDANGGTSILRTTGASSGGIGVYTFPVEIRVIIVGSVWSGDYQVVFIPSTPVPQLSAVLTASSITPVGNGTTSPIVSLSTDTGIVTAAST